MQGEKRTWNSGKRAALWGFGAVVVATAATFGLRGWIAPPWWVSMATLVTIYAVVSIPASLELAETPNVRRAVITAFLRAAATWVGLWLFFAN